MKKGIRIGKGEGYLVDLVLGSLHSNLHGG